MQHFRWLQTPSLAEKRAVVGRNQPEDQTTWVLKARCFRRSTLTKAAQRAPEVPMKQDYCFR